MLERNLRILRMHNAISRLRKFPYCAEHYTWHWGTLWPVLAVMVGWVAPLVYIGYSINWTQIYRRNLSSKEGRGSSEREVIRNNFFQLLFASAKNLLSHFQSYEVLALSMPDKRSKLEVFTLLLG